MTAPNTFNGQPTTLEDTVFLNCFNSVLRTGRAVPATSGKKWRNAVFIEIDRQQKNKLKYFFHFLVKRIKHHDRR